MTIQPWMRGPDGFTAIPSVVSAAHERFRQRMALIRAVDGLHSIPLLVWS
jgi:hypothetical protein